MATRRALTLAWNVLSDLTRARFPFEPELKACEVLLHTGGIHQASLSAATNSRVEVFVLRRVVC